MNNIWLAFITGLTTGGISCIAVQGGLLTSSIAQQSETKETQKGNWKFVLLFLLAKLTAYTVLGFLLGTVGSLLTFSPKVLATLQLIIGLFLLGTAARLLNLHPVFRYFAIQPPKFVYKIARKESGNASFLAPAFLGALTVLMPCGVTQAMMMVALASGSAVTASAIMFAFVLGTSPVFFTLGIAALKLLKNKAFNYIAATVLFIFAIISLNGAMGLYGSPHTLKNFWMVITGGDKLIQNAKSANVTEGVQEATITVTNKGYESDVATLKAGVPVRLKLVTNNTQSCSRAFTIPSLNIRKILPVTGTEEITFTPSQPGRLAYSCSMGMYTGSFNVVE